MGQEQHLSYKVTKEILAKQLHEGKIDTSAYADACCRFFLEREGSLPLREAYEKVQSSPLLENVRRGSFALLMEGKKLIPPAEVKKAAKYLSAIDKKLDYTGFVASFVRTEGSDVGLNTDRIHFEKIFQVLARIPEEEVGKRALFTAALANHIAEYRMTAKASGLIFASHSVKAQAGYEEQFWNDKLIGRPQNEGIEFCKAYRAYAAPLIERQAAIVYGSQKKGKEIMELWSEACHITGDGSVEELAMGNARKLLLEAIIKGDSKEIVQAAVDVARMHPAFVPFARRLAGAHALQHRTQEAEERQTRGAASVDERTIKADLRQYRAAFRLIESKNSRLNNEKIRNEKLQQYVGKVFVKKHTTFDVQLPPLLYKIDRGPSEPRDEYYFDHTRKVQAKRTVSLPKVIAIEYEYSAKEKGYAQKGIHPEDWVARMIPNKNLIEATDRYGSLIP